ncbi:S24/S26 family peptidase [Natrinema altunense]|uniref:Peptidase S24/S26A/S26B, conserved region n=1 Tax=Natrinema altunense (strain JCM 12890 / CGMCC 1.3731 / AJ2) TaxID=1227494 RepID=L9ZD25_NATA2|nr:S26 family signal peptidase [Natrinema altunense]ELY83048.1 peptidase S24/S26A/S26B, conserved region [Natrinema altunense JCM 12890]
MTDASADGPSDGSDRTETAARADADDETGFARRLLDSDDETVVLVRDIATVVAVVAIICLGLFAVSGVWPPFVAVESGSMEPNMHKGDMIGLVQADRFAGDDAVAGTGLVTAERGRATGHEQFGHAGDVIVYTPNGDPATTPIIHRVRFWVEAGDNWVADADPAYTDDRSCAEIRSCPAPHDGFITKGDANADYDQLDGKPKTTVVRPDWIVGKAVVRIPWLGTLRLLFESIVGVGTVGVGLLATTASE